MNDNTYLFSDMKILSSVPSYISVVLLLLIVTMSLAILSGSVDRYRLINHPRTPGQRS